MFGNFASVLNGVTACVNSTSWTDMPSCFNPLRGYYIAAQEITALFGAYAFLGMLCLLTRNTDTRSYIYHKSTPQSTEEILYDTLEDAMQNGMLKLQLSALTLTESGAKAAFARGEPLILVGALDAYVRPEVLKKFAEEKKIRYTFSTC